MTEDSALKISDNVILDSTINVGHSTCPSCDASGNIRLMVCQEHDCDYRFCEICNPNSRFDPVRISQFRFDSGLGSGPFCKSCLDKMMAEARWEQAKEEKRALEEKARLAEEQKARVEEAEALARRARVEEAEALARRAEEEARKAEALARRAEEISRELEARKAEALARRDRQKAEVASAREKARLELHSKPRNTPKWQQFLMLHYQNAFPILNTIVVLFIGIWIVNAMGLLVDGSGRNIAFDGDQPALYDTGGVYELVEPGEIYPCDNDIQVGECKFTFTPFAGENGDHYMPAGFYWDGISFMVLGIIAMFGIYLLQMHIYKKRVAFKEAIAAVQKEAAVRVEEKWRRRGEGWEITLSDYDGDVERFSVYADDEIDIGDRVGVEIEDGEEAFGEIIEFWSDEDEDDDEVFVVVKLDAGDERLVDFEAIFMHYKTEV